VLPATTPYSPHARPAGDALGRGLIGLT
jgi:hypothetical protein